MAAPFSKGIGTAVKRARSQDSLRSSGTPHSAKTDEADEPSNHFGIPAFLRQSRAGKYPKSLVVLASLPRLHMHRTQTKSSAVRHQL